MCRLFGLTAGRARVRATFWLVDASDSLDEQSHANPDGTGLGVFDRNGRPAVDKWPIAAFEDRAFVVDAKERESSTFVAHVRHASTGALTVANTHPFLIDGRIGAHNGVVEGLDDLERYLGNDLSLVHGDTDSERVLALVARETRERGGDLGAGIVSALTWIGENLPVFAANLVIATEHQLWAARYPDTHELWIVQRPHGRPLHHRSSTGTQVHSTDATHHPTVVVASEPMDDEPGWRRLAPNTVTLVDDRLNVIDVAELEPPRHPLALADLGEVAARSQQAQRSSPR